MGKEVRCVICHCRHEVRGPVNTLHTAVPVSHLHRLLISPLLSPPTTTTPLPSPVATTPRAQQHSPCDDDWSSKQSLLCCQDILVDLSPPPERIEREVNDGHWPRVANGDANPSAYVYICPAPVLFVCLFGLLHQRLLLGQGGYQYHQQRPVACSVLASSIYVRIYL